MGTEVLNIVLMSFLLQMVKMTSSVDATTLPKGVWVLRNQIKDEKMGGERRMHGRDDTVFWS
jgi:hypothetical protein